MSIQDKSPIIITVTSNSKCVCVVSPKTKTVRIIYRDITESDLSLTELERLDTYITQYELIGYVLSLPIEC